MKHFLLTLLLVVLATGLFNCSGDNEYETEYYNGVDPQFNTSDKELGSIMRESLRKTTLQAISEKVDFKDRTAMRTISAQVSLEVLSSRYPERKKEIAQARQEFKLAQERILSNGRTADADPETLEDVLNSDAVELTTMQRRALEVIEYARNTSSSATVFMDKLGAINRRVDDLVPEGEREMLHQYISVIYHSLEEINHLVAEGHLPGQAEKRPEIVSNVRVAQRGGLRLSDLMQTAYANSEVTVLPQVVIVGSSNNSGGISYSDWYNLQEAYNNGYNNGYTNGYDNGYNNGYNSGYQNGSNSNQQEQSWWNSWGKCTVGSALVGTAAGIAATGIEVVTLGTGTPVAIGILAFAGTWILNC